MLILLFLSLFSGGEEKICPRCDSAITRAHCFRDKFAQRELLKLETYCPNKNTGCIWTGKNQDIEVCSNCLLRLYTIRIFKE